MSKAEPARRARDEGRTNRSAFEASRMNAFSFDPEDLVLIEDPKHQLYDARVKAPIPPHLVASIKAHGITTPVIIRKMDDKPVVVDGRHRVRIARMLNETAKADGRDTIMVPAVVRRGDEADAYTVTCAANLHAPDDKVREQAAKAQRLAQLGRGEGDIAIALGVSVATVKRYLDANIKERSAPKKRGPSKRPKTSDVAKLAGANGLLNEREHLIVDWVLGKKTTADLVNEIPQLGEVFG